MSLSNRFIEATATCEAFRIQSYDWNNTYNLVYTLADGTDGTLPEVYLNDGTTYISSVYDLDDLEIVNCGPRCGNLNVTQIGDISNVHDNAWLYVCQSTVYEVDGALIDEERVSDGIALTASVSLSGGGYSDPLDRFYGYYPDK